MMDFFKDLAHAKVVSYMEDSKEICDISNIRVCTKSII